LTFPQSGLRNKRKLKRHDMTDARPAEGERGKAPFEFCTQKRRGLNSKKLKVNYHYLRYGEEWKMHKLRSRPGRSKWVLLSNRGVNRRDKSAAWQESNPETEIPPETVVPPNAQKDGGRDDRGSADPKTAMTPAGKSGGGRESVEEPGGRTESSLWRHSGSVRR